MVKRKVDNLLRVLTENGIGTGHRSLFVIVGDKSREQVIYLHHILSKASLKQANVLWCYKHKLTFSSHRRKRMKQLKAKQKYGNADVNEDDPFEMFVSMTEIRYCYYKETHKILGNTFKMCVLQDFESLTPNILCRTIETVEGGGIIAILLESMASLKQLYTLNMDVHSRYRTEAHQHVVPRFNERFIMSLASCPSCLVLDDKLQVLPISSLTKNVEPLPYSYTDRLLTKIDENLKLMQEKNKELKPLGVLLSLCRTCDQGEVVKEFIAAITENTLSSTVTLTAPRGRGKSAAMGLSLAGAIFVGYSNMFVTSPSPENLNTFFEFLLKGLDALGYEKHTHYQTLTSANPEHNKAIMRITIKKEHKQYVQYISPYECDVLGNAELVVIDEAAAIPLPQVQALMGPYLVFLASTISGYEGTGRSLSLKLIKELKDQARRSEEATDADRGASSGVKRLKLENETRKRKLVELELKESIRYKPGDHVEKWLYDLLCLESSLPALKKEELPNPEDCNLYYVNRDMLFCYHKLTEKFLKNVMSLLVASHYKNTPDDLQTLSDAPAHHLFVLLHPNVQETCPKPICVLQVAFEGKISKLSIHASDSEARKPAGDMIPWTINSYYDDEEFPQLSGARIIRIATHPDVQGLGYGSRAMRLLEEYYSKSSHKASTENILLPKENPAFKCIEDEEISNLNPGEGEEPSQPLLVPLEEREAEPLHYLGVSFGSSFPLVKFWKKLGFLPVYISQAKNIQTGEFSSLFLKVLNEDKGARETSWLRDITLEFKDIMVYLLQGSFRQLDTKFALSFIANKIYKRKRLDPFAQQLKPVISSSNLAYIGHYIDHSKEFSQISYLFYRLSILYFQDKIPISSFKTLKQAIIVGVGIQMKSPSMVAKELEIELALLMSEIYSIVTEFYQYLVNKYSNTEES